MKKALILILGYMAALDVYAQEPSDGISVPEGNVELPVSDERKVSPLEDGGQYEVPVHSLFGGSALLFSSNSFSGFNGRYVPALSGDAYKLKSGLPAWFVYSADVQSYPGMMQKEAGSVGFAINAGRFTYGAYAGAVKYGSFNSLVTSYYIGGVMNYRLNPYMDLTVFGTYYSRNPYLGAGAYPYVQTSNFGGYVTLSPNSAFSVSLGAKTYYDPFRRRMETDPIIVPSFKVNKVRIGIDVGHAAKSYLQSLFHHLSR